MKKILAMLLATVMVVGCFTGCGSDKKNDSSEVVSTEQSGSKEETPELDMSETVKMGILVSDATSAEALAFRTYYTEYIQKQYNVELIYSDELKDAAGETSAIDTFITNNCKAIISFSSFDRAAQIEQCEAAGVYYAVATGTLTDQFMLDGYKNGLLSRERLLDANRRILALKASLRLHEKKIKRQLVPGKEALKNLRTTEHIQWAKELADQSVTLVKDIAENLPISAKKTPRILLEILGHFPSNERVVGKVKEELEKRNFQVFLYEKEDFEKGVDNVTAFKDKYDMVIYIGNVENASNQTTNRLNWYTFWGQGNNVPWFAEEVPVIFISVANPYHLLDVPMIKTYINCYSNNDYVLEAVIAKIAGESRFKGVSPVDPFCGRIELSY